MLGDPHEDCAHAFFHCTEGELCPQRATWHAQMAEALRGSRAYPTPGMSPLVWTNIDPSIRLSLALGAPPPVSWHFPGPQRHASDALRHSCHQACVQASASFALLICKALRQYHEAVTEDLEANHTTSWPAVSHSLGLDDMHPAHAATVPSDSDSEDASYDADDDDSSA